MFVISSTLRQSKAALLKLIPLADVRMASGEGSQSNTPADEVSPPAEMANLDELPPSQAQRVLEAALQYYRRMDDREPGETTVTASSLLAGGLIPTSSSTGESLPQYGAVVQGTLAPPLARHGCSLPRLHASSQAPQIMAACSLDPPCGQGEDACPTVASGGTLIAVGQLRSRHC